MADSKRALLDRLTDFIAQVTTTHRWIPYAGYALLTVLVIHYPLAFHFGEHVVGARDIDIWMKLWDNWRFERMLLDGEPAYYTRYLFYPDGANLRFHSMSWLLTAIWFSLSRIMDGVDAYNLITLLTAFFSACCGYWLLRHLLDSDMAAWLGGLLFAASPIRTSVSGSTPDLSNIQWIPLTLLAVYLIIERKQMRFVVMAAALVLLSALTSLYIMVYVALSVSLLVLYIAVVEGRWRDRDFLRLMGLFAVLSSLFLAPRMAPIFLDSGGLSATLEKPAPEIGQADVLAFVTPSRYHGFYFRVFNVGPQVDKYPINRKHTVYLGVLLLPLVGLALASKEHRRRDGVWYASFAFFILLALGPVLRFNGGTYPKLWMPARLLAWMPFVGGLEPDRFSMAIVLPFTVIVSRGMEHVLTRMRLPRPVQLLMPLTLMGLILFETWDGRMLLQSTQVHPFYHQIATEAGEFAIIELPTGRQASKPHMFAQTIHGRPMLEGAPGRTTPESYDYIHAHPLLEMWVSHTYLDCALLDYEAEMQTLADDGFRYIILHRNEDGTISFRLEDYFAVEPIVDDDQIKVYAIDDIIAGPSPCP